VLVLVVGSRKVAMNNAPSLQSSVRPSIGDTALVLVIAPEGQKTSSPASGVRSE
jgi:hypothetical protein